MKSYIILDEVYDVLNNEIEQVMLSKNLQQEMSYLCDLSSDDDYYVFADLIRSRKSKSSWELMKNNDNIIMVLESPQIELKLSVYKILNKSNVIHNGIISNNFITIN